MAELTQDTRQVSRRRFLGIAWGASLVALVAQAGIAFIKFFRPRLEQGGFGTIVPAGRVEEFPEDSISQVQSGRFYISHVEDGLLAMWQSCTHLGCTVPWVEEEAQFHCPCHSSLFNRKGEVIGGPAPRPLDLFPIEIVDGEVLVDTGKPTQRNRYDPSQATSV
jgi:cytochrome b6-f complex iron-sulfur subunit